MAKAKITDFKQHKANANKGSERGEYMIETSLREVGAWRSVGADRNGTIGVGNKTTQKWQEIANPDDVIIVPSDGTKLVIVQRTDLDFDSDDPEVVERTVKAAYFDNRASEVSMTWDAEQVLADITAGVDLDAMFSQREIDELLADLLPKNEGDAEPQIDRAEELNKVWQVQPGDVWVIGDHRLVCGDCTDPAVVAKVMQGEKAQAVVTDPPYGVMAFGGRRQTHEAKNIEFIENDDLVGDSLIEFLTQFIDACPVSNESSFYVCYGWKSQAEFTQALRDSGLTLRATITWVKNVFGLSAKNNVGYRPQTEFIYFATKSKDYDWKWNGGGAQSNAWHIDRPTERVGNHPTNKPLELPCKCIENSTDAGDIVYEPFAGSGTTLVACQNLGRRGRGIEISPSYCAVILQRMQDAFGITGVRLG